MSAALGTITFVISDNHREQEVIGPVEAEQITDAFIDYFKWQLKARKLDHAIAVTGFKWTTGCITIIITIGAVAAAAGGGFAVGKFFKEYKDIREGVSKLIEDLKNAKVWVARKLGKKTASSAALPPGPIAIKDKGQGALKVMFEQLSDSYQLMAPEHRKYWTAGQEMTIVNESGDFCKYTVAVKVVNLPLSKEVAESAPPGETPEKNERKKR